MNLLNLRGDGVVLDIPTNSIQNSVSETISLDNLYPVPTKSPEKIRTRGSVLIGSPVIGWKNTVYVIGEIISPIKNII